MENLEFLRKRAASLTVEAFEESYPYGFLVRRKTSLTPAHGIDRPGVTSTPEWATNVHDRESLAGQLDLAMLEGRGWMVLEIAKRQGNPYPDRVSIGRATNCDVVLRFGSVSKLHAHIHLGEDRSLRVTDLRSANGTFINGKQLVEAEGTTLTFGDRLRFGVVELEVLSSRATYAILKTAMN